MILLIAKPNIQVSYTISNIFSQEHNDFQILALVEMKMEVVLSAPGCFSNDGTPFKNEEIREWSRVDRLTGMLERARIETGRWRTGNDASAHSYGKVTDLRERNSADGCIMQKAKRQVEIFQSKEPGRSVQVFRASQWSSSRVTDGIAKSIMPNRLDPMLNEINEALETDSWKFPSLTLPDADEIPMDLIDNDTFLPIKDSMQTQSNGFEKYLLPKRCNSDEDLSNFISSDGSSRISSMSFARDCKSRRSLQIPTSISVSIPNHSELKNDDSSKEIYSKYKTFPNSSGTYASSVRIEDERKSNDYDLPRRKSPVVMSSPRHSSITRPNAITVVNLMHPESFQDNSRNKKSSIVTLRSSPVHPENSQKNHKSSVTKTNSSGDEGGVNLPSKAVKKVGFCKTEVHFAADSGKVNIVETDGKPPPTNKFRRRRKNQNQTGTSGNLVGRSLECGNNGNGNRAMPRRMIIKSEVPDNEDKIPGLVDNDNSGAYCVVDLESRKFWANPDMNPKIHMTTVKFGKSDKRPREHEELKNPDELASPKVVSEVLTRKIKGPDCSNVITTDSENNRVLSTFVTTHESTVARVEDNLMNSKKLVEESRSKSPSSNKKNDSKKMVGVDTVDKGKKISKDKNISKSLKDSPVYMNVFKTLDNRYPIYENYRADIMKEKSIPIIMKATNTGGLSMAKGTLEKKRSKAKSPNKLGKRSPVSLSRLSSLSKSSGKQQDSPKIKILKKSTVNGETIKSTDKSSPINLESKAKNSEQQTGSTRSKRVPMEVVYRTAVFNMKNEKLSKPTKGKDTKTQPRSINDLICGSKTNRAKNSKRKSKHNKFNSVLFSLCNTINIIVDCPGSVSSQSSTKGAPQTKHWK
ncbi:hypothetical protein PV325_007789 [Microctonus aethiopoides]|nr:hypothetical protein PV325_007789 [Microctonus aethiopoides]